MACGRLVRKAGGQMGTAFNGPTLYKERDKPSYLWEYLAEKIKHRTGKRKNKPFEVESHAAQADLKFPM